MANSLLIEVNDWLTTLDSWGGCETSVTNVQLVSLGKRRHTIRVQSKSIFNDGLVLVDLCLNYFEQPALFDLIFVLLLHDLQHHLFQRLCCRLRRHKQVICFVFLHFQKSECFERSVAGDFESKLGLLLPLVIRTEHIRCYYVYDWGLFLAGREFLRTLAFCFRYTLLVTQFSGQTRFLKRLRRTCVQQLCGTLFVQIESRLIFLEQLVLHEGF